MAKAQTGADVKGQFKSLSEADIQAYTDSQSFRKGNDYYLNRAIVGPVLSESVLRAFCHGSTGGPYRVEATLLPVKEKSASKLASGSCSCPRGGFCKHLVALLLTWVHHPEWFAVRSGLMGRLQEKSHAELLALLEHLLQRQPDIEPLVELLIELPVTSAEQEESQPGKGRERTVDPSSIRSQVDTAFYDAGEGWDAASRAAPDLEQLYEIGKSFAETGYWANAQVVYATLAEEAIAQYEELQDEGQVSWVIGECAAGLVECLDVQSTLPPNEQLYPEDREELFTTLFELWKFGHDYGGVEVNIPAAVAKNATEDERKRVEGWLREEMMPGQDYSSQWRNRRTIDFLATLKQAVHFSEDELLEEYRKVGLYKEMTEKLLQFGRRDEALDVAKTRLTEPRDTIWFAEQLIKSSDAWREQALAFVEMRLKEAEESMRAKPEDFTGRNTVDTYRHWLGERYTLYGKTQEALNMEQLRFQANPDIRTYHSVRSAAQLAGQPEELWPSLRPGLIQTLEQQRRWGALVSIYLEEGEVGQALSALTEMERSSDTSSYGYGYGTYSSRSEYQVQVAKAAEVQYPDEAIRLYKSAVQRLIDLRGRENYQQATGHLTRVKLLYQKQEREPEWNTYITNLRNSNKSLRALKEELDKRGM
jgi:uncharacterized Zn finger protein